MSNTGNNEQKGSQEGFALGIVESGTTDCSLTAHALEDNWQTLGNLARKVLSCTYEARKKAPETTGERRSGASLARPTTVGVCTGGGVGSNTNTGAAETDSFQFVRYENRSGTAANPDERFDCVRSHLRVLRIMMKR